MPKLSILGLNHKTAPLEVRERLSFSPAQQAEALARWKQQHPQQEMVLLPTCNRVELYVSGSDAAALHAASAFLADFHGVPLPQFLGHLYQLSARAAVEHLFSVVTSLDSMVLGEHQILGQVRQAYEAAQSAGLTGGTLNPLFQRALAVGKEVFSTTRLTDGRSSVSGVAVEYARRIFDHFDDKKIVCIGAGKMALLALRGLAELGPRELVICNRDLQKAKKLAEQFGGSGAGIAELGAHLLDADIVITSTGSERALITRRQMEEFLPQRRYRPLFIIDIAVPRDVEPTVGELDQVYLCNLDDLQQAIAQTESKRGDLLGPARAIVQSRVEEFLEWQRQREMGPMIEQLYQRIHALADEEVQRTLATMPDATAAQRDEMQQMARRMANQFLHDPVRALRSSGTGHASPARYLHALEQLFKLNQGRSDGGNSGVS